MASKNFRDLPPQQQGLVLAIFIVLVFGVVFYDLVKPLHPQLTALDARLKTLQTQNLRDRMLESSQKSLTERVAQAQLELQQLRQIVPDQPADDQLVKTVYTAATASSVHIRSLKAGTAVPGSDFDSLPFALRADGTYYQMLGFFARLAASQRIIKVSGLTLASAGMSGGTYKIGPQETVTADCTLTTYYNRPSGTVTAKKAAMPRR
jgi:Tfp pilus assembly protein PilO